MGSKTVILSQEAIDIKLAKNGARPIENPEIVCDDHPAVDALPEIEKEIWLLHSRGMQGIEIAEILNLREDIVSRALRGIRAKFEFLARFREELEKRPSLKEKFYNIARGRKVIKCGKIVIRK